MGGAVASLLTGGGIRGGGYGVVGGEVGSPRGWGGIYSGTLRRRSKGMNKLKSRWCMVGGIDCGVGAVGTVYDGWGGGTGRYSGVWV